MGLGKRYWEGRQFEKEVALTMLVEARVCDRCDAHPEIASDILGDPEPAYRLANRRWEGNLEEVFSSRREMTDRIKEAFEEAGAVDGCPYCAKD